MKTDTSNVDSFDVDARLPTNTVFELLLEQRRRYALRYLSQNVGALSVADLVDAIANAEGASGDEREEIVVELHHNHLRKLIDADVVRYDSDAGTVERRPAARALDPYLELASKSEL